MNNAIKRNGFFFIIIRERPEKKEERDNKRSD